MGVTPPSIRRAAGPSNGARSSAWGTVVPRKNPADRELSPAPSAPIETQAKRLGFLLLSQTGLSLLNCKMSLQANQA